MPVENRWRGNSVFNRVNIKSLFMSDSDAGTSTEIEFTALVTELNKFASAPLAITPSALSTQQSTSALFNAPAVLNRATASDTGLLTARGVIRWWVETTAAYAAAASDGTITGTSGTSSSVIVIADSTQYNSGIVISNSTGDIGIAFTGSTADGDLHLFYVLPSGLVQAGSTLAFST